MQASPNTSSGSITLTSFVAFAIKKLSHFVVWKKITIEAMSMNENIISRNCFFSHFQTILFRKIITKCIESLCKNIFRVVDFNYTSVIFSSKCQTMSRVFSITALTPPPFSNTFFLLNKTFQIFITKNIFFLPW